MASGNQTSEVALQPARGSALLRLAIGKRLTDFRRYVLGLGQSNDKLGHGVTELAFDHLILTVRPGTNEDYIVIERGQARGLNPRYWTLVEAEQIPQGARCVGARLQSVDLYTDGQEDVALQFHFDENRSFSLILCDTDLRMAEGLETLYGALERVEPRLRESIVAGSE